MEEKKPSRELKVASKQEVLSNLSRPTGEGTGTALEFHTSVVEYVVDEVSVTVERLR